MTNPPQFQKPRRGRKLGVHNLAENFPDLPTYELRQAEAVWVAASLVAEGAHSWRTAARTLRLHPSTLSVWRHKPGLAAIAAEAAQQHVTAA
jgi:hypothetical protein